MPVFNNINYNTVGVDQNYADEVDHKLQLRPKYGQRWGSETDAEGNQIIKTDILEYVDYNGNSVDPSLVQSRSVGGAGTRDSHPVYTLKNPEQNSFLSGNAPTVPLAQEMEMYQTGIEGESQTPTYGYRPKASATPPPPPPANQQMEMYQTGIEGESQLATYGYRPVSTAPVAPLPPAPLAPPPPPPAPVAAPPVEAPVAAPATPTVPEPPVLPSSDIQPATTAPVAPTTTASPTMATATTSNIDPTIQPYLSYGLSEAQKLYQGGGPQYYGGQTYVSPSEQTQTGLQALEQRASKGSPLTGAAQSQLQGTIQGNYLSGNPFFQGAFNPAAQAAESKFKQSLGDIGSAASKAGRYGSGAMSTMQQGASGQFAKTLADTAGTLAYQNYSDERGRQQAATMAAPAMAQSDYADIQNMLKAGQMREGYTGAQQQADIAKFNFQQTQPQQNLANFLSGVYGNPLGRAQQGGTTAAQPSGWQNLLGGAATAAGIYKTLGGAQGVSQIGNWLTGGGSNNAFVPSNIDANIPMQIGGGY